MKGSILFTEFGMFFSFLGFLILDMYFEMQINNDNNSIAALPPHWIRPSLELASQTFK